MMELDERARGKRYDHAIQEALKAAGHDTSVREVRIALKEGRIRINGRTRKPGDRAKGGEGILLEAFFPRKEAIVEPEDLLLESANVLYEDLELLALSKVTGIAVAPLRPGEKGTLLAAALAVDPAIASAGPPLEGGLCHRLDIDTSGIVVFAKNAAKREQVRAEFSQHRIEKRYFALVSDPQNALDAITRIDGAILGAGERVRVVEPGTEDALEASTEVHVLERLRGAYRWIEAVTMTGRRHQIRAHLASIGAPIAGDRVYGDGPNETVQRLALHAHRMTFPGGLQIEGPIHRDLAHLLEQLRK